MVLTSLSETVYIEMYIILPDMDMEKIQRMGIVEMFIGRGWTSSPSILRNIQDPLSTGVESLCCIVL